MDYRIEVLTLPVSDVDRAIAFYTKMAGFELDVDYRPNDHFRVVQLTPPGSGCSIQFGTGFGACLVVSDIEAAHRDLAGRGLDVGPLRHKAGMPDWQGDFVPGSDPAHRNYASFFDFTDLDGNTWTVQERGPLEK
ncbi:VOC family protein [Lentzea albida]|uniref:Catechol 2,3-dioxygenase n=1 Tax=Lentzea albida TaxID=65499 RepID=A0A1H9LKB8_9PSEU|nr:VOC family protein [Lentzea albida]SER11555.1 Catechol 2,3-dioxygenase [Lentzea albida]